MFATQHFLARAKTFSLSLVLLTLSLLGACRGNGGGYPGSKAGSESDSASVVTCSFALSTDLEGERSGRIRLYSGLAETFMATVAEGSTTHQFQNLNLEDDSVQLRYVGETFALTIQLEEGVTTDLLSSVSAIRDDETELNEDDVLCTIE